MRTIMYHDNCYDGFCCRVIAQQIHGNNIRYLPVNYGREDWKMEQWTKDDSILICDFSYPRDTLLQLKERVDCLEVLDHHISAERELSDLDFCIFDNTKSGAQLTWEWFHPHTETPLIVQYIQDHDLFRFLMTHSHAIKYWLRSYPMDYNIWDRWFTSQWEAELDQWIDEGLAIQRYHNQCVEEIAKTAIHVDEHHRLSFLHDELKLSCPLIFASDVGRYLLEQYPHIDFINMIHNRSDGKIVHSLRGQPSVDCSLIAKKYGGGGHHEAAGFTE